MCSGCGAKIAQILLFIINFIVWVVGIVLIGVGAYAMVEAEKYGVIFGDENNLRAVAVFMLCVGVIIFFVGFFGCCGAFKRSGCMLKIYFAFVLLIIIMEVVAGILALVYKDLVVEAIGDGIIETMEEYNGESNNAFTQAIDNLQRQFDCCGSANPSDWDSLNSTTSWTGFPLSCCVDENVDCKTDPAGGSNVKQTGCVKGFTEWVEGNYIMIGGVSLGLLVFEVFALIFACCLIKAKDEEKGL